MRKSITLEKASEAKLNKKNSKTDAGTDGKGKVKFSKTKFRKAIESKSLAKFEADIEKIDELTDEYIENMRADIVKATEEAQQEGFESDMQKIDELTDEYIKVRVSKAVEASETKMLKGFDEDMEEVNDAFELYVKAIESGDLSDNDGESGDDFENVDADGNIITNKEDVKIEGAENTAENTDEDFEARVEARVKEEVAKILKDVEHDVSILDNTVEEHLKAVDEETNAKIDEDMYAVDDMVADYVADIEKETIEKVYESVKKSFGSFGVNKLKAVEARKLKYPNIDGSVKYTKVGESKYIKTDKVTGYTEKATEEETFELDALGTEEEESTNEVAEYVESVMEKEDVTTEEMKEVITMMKDEMVAVADIADNMEIGDEEIPEDDIAFDEDEMLGEEEDEFDNVELEDVDEEMLDDMEGLEDEDVEFIGESIKLGKIRSMDQLKKVVETRRYYNGYTLEKSAESKRIKRENEKAGVLGFIRSKINDQSENKVMHKSAESNVNPAARFF